MVAEIDAEAVAGKTEADAAAPKTEPDAAAAETTNEPDRAGHVSAETNGSATGPTTGPTTDENVSAETSVDEPVTVTGTPTPMRTGRATALIHVAEHYLATGGSGARPLTSSEAYQVFVHVNANDAGPDNRINGAHTCYADDRHSLAPHVVRQLACDASRRTVLENERGEVLNIGRRSRTVPRRIGHALRIRDGGCRFPGCGPSTPIGTLRSTRPRRLPLGKANAWTIPRPSSGYCTGMGWRSEGADRPSTPLPRLSLPVDSIAHCRRAIPEPTCR